MEWRKGGTILPSGIWGGGEGVVVGAQVTVFSGSALHSAYIVRTVYLSSGTDIT